MNTRSLMLDSLWDMSEQLNKPMLQLPMSPPLLVLAVLGPLVTVERNARKTGAETRAEAKAKT
eukprot:4509146-Pyramimonas_sp.AAC.3